MNIKSDFPIFATHPDLVYLDSASTTHKPDFVIDQTDHYIANSYANIWRGSYPLAMESEDIYDASKAAAARLISASADQIIYTHSSTYAYNMLAYSLVESGILTHWSSIILSISEHHANLVIWQKLSQSHRFIIKMIGITVDGGLDYDDLVDQMDETVQVVSLTGASNVTGAITDIARVRQIIGSDVLFAIDGSQLVPNRRVDVQALWVDVLIWTTHKMLGFTGLWIMYLNTKWMSRLTCPRVGGGVIEEVSSSTYTLQRWSITREPGTPNLISAASYLYALQYFDSIGGYDWWETYEQELIDYFMFKLEQQSVIKLASKSVSEWQTSTPRDLAISCTQLWVFSFYLTDWSSVLKLGENLGQQGICIRTWGHCAHPLVEQLGHDQLGRLSLYIYNTKEDIDQFFEAITKL